MRDRLIELIINADTYDSYECKLCNKDDDACNCCYAEKLADRLLANGVVVIRCNIGDTVYQTDGVRIYEFEIFDVKLIKNKPCYETESIDFDDNEIGKTVFLTREEAERALKGEKV